jgi:hypothetical protein
MRGIVAATAVLGVLAIGGLPVLALTLADSETSSQDTARPAADQRPGPPPWAHAYGRDGKPAKPDKLHKDKSKDKAERPDRDDADDGDDDRGTDGPPGWARGGDQVPPGWAKHAGSGRGR